MVYCVPHHSLAFQWVKSYRELTKTKKEDERVSVSSVALCSSSLSASLLKVLLISVDVKAHALVRVWHALLLCKCSIISSISETVRMCLWMAVFAAVRELWALWLIDKPSRLDLLLFVYFGMLPVSLVTVCLQRDMLFRVTCGTVSSAVSCGVCFCCMGLVQQLFNYVL